MPVSVRGRPFVTDYFTSGQNVIDMVPAENRSNGAGVSMVVGNELLTQEEFRRKEIPAGVPIYMADTDIKQGCIYAYYR